MVLSLKNSKISRKWDQEGLNLFLCLGTLTIAFRVVTSQTTMVPEVNQSTETNSKMKTFNWSTLDQEFSQWPMLDQTRMVHNSFFALLKLNGLTERFVLLSEQSGRRITKLTETLSVVRIHESNWFLARCFRQCCWRYGCCQEGRISWIPIWTYF